MRSVACLALLLAAVPACFAQPAIAPGAPASALPRVLPATMDHHRFFVEAAAPGGKLLHLFTDSGGGMNLSTRGADKLGLAYEVTDGTPTGAAGMAAWPFDASLPKPLGAGDDYVLPILELPPGIKFDGMLGAPWFGDRTWQWDYRAGMLRLLPDGALPDTAPEHTVALGFQADANGAHTTHFPRIPARVDGAELQFLFDTGATFRLDEAAAATLGDAAVRERAGSFITASVLQEWRARHPDWPYLERGDAGAPMIQVPSVELAGYRTGPVWFSARPDRAFHEYMAQWMDRPVDGALGGNVFAGFRVTVDYVAAKAVFER